jgi:hypothetical protein
MDVGVEPKYEGPENIAKYVGFLHRQVDPASAFEEGEDTPPKIRRGVVGFQINARSAIPDKVRSFSIS